jgi:hypothetical protein
LASDTLLTAVDLTGHSLGRPMSANGIFHPMLAALDDSSLIMLWGEPDTTAAARRFLWQPPLAQVWSARWQRGNGWTTPHLILWGNPASLWNGRQSTEPVRSSDGDVHLAVPTIHGVRYLRYHAGEWRVSTIPHVPGGSAYSSIAADATGRVLLVAYVGVDTTATRDYNSVLMVRSTDGGATWSTPAVIHASKGHRPAFEVQVRAQRSFVRMLWLQDLDGDETPDAIRAVSSSDGGISWTSPRDVRLPQGPRALKSAIDSCGLVHAVYEDWNGGGTDGHLDYVRFTGTAWTTVQHLSPHRTAMSATIAVPSPDELLLMWLASDRPSQPDHLRTWYSRLPVRVWRRPD